MFSKEIKFESDEPDLPFIHQSPKSQKLNEATFIPIHPIDSEDDLLLEIYNPATCPFMDQFESIGDQDLFNIIEDRFLPLIQELKEKNINFTNF